MTMRLLEHCLTIGSQLARSSPQDNMTITVKKKLCFKLSWILPITLLECGAQHSVEIINGIICCRGKKLLESDICCGTVANCILG